MLFLSFFSVNNSVKCFSGASLLVSKSIRFSLFNLPLFALIIFLIPISLVSISLLKQRLLRFYQLFLDQFLGLFLAILLHFQVCVNIFLFRIGPSANFISTLQIYCLHHLWCMFILTLLTPFVHFWPYYFPFKSDSFYGSFVLRVRLVVIFLSLLGFGVK